MALDLTCLATVKANSMSSISCGVGWRRVTIFRSEAAMRPAVARLDEEAAGHRAENLAGRQRIGQAVGQQQAQVLFGGEDGPGLLVSAGGDDHLGEDVGDQPGVGAGQGAVDGDDAAEGRDGVALQRPGIGGRQIAAHGDAAGVGVFDDDAGRGLELGDQLIGGVGVGDVVVAQFLALRLPGMGDAGAGVAGAVEGPVWCGFSP